jgi:hypothetical protein
MEATVLTESTASALTHVDASVAKAFADLDALAESARNAQDSLQHAMREAQRAAALVDFDDTALQEFLTKPYLVRALGNGQYELIVPRFVGFRAGWPVRHDGPYTVYLVSKFINMLAPLPDWLAGELGFAAPSFGAALDGNVLTVTRGDAATVMEKLGGSKAIARREGNRLILRPASRFDILRRIIREEGFLPYSPQPVPTDLRRESQVARDDGGKPAFTLRPHQVQDYQRFMEAGAVSVFAFPQTGKSYLPLQAFADLKGPKLILCPRRSLVDQWQARLALFLTPEAAAEVTVSTYQGARKFLGREWTLVVFDEAHHLPADFAIESASTIKTVARMALSATPRREDGNEDLIPALGGFPVGLDWPVSATQRPTVTVWIVKDEAAKLKLARRLCESPVDGKTFVFTYRLEIGARIAKLLDVPFVYSKTKKPLKVMAENDTVVVSSVGNEGLSFPIRRVVEVDFLFGSKQEAGQRLGRLAYEIVGKDKPGEYHVLMTPAEYSGYAKRLLIYEQWGLEIDVRTLEGAGGVEMRVQSKSVRPRAATRPRRVVSLAGTHLHLPQVQVSAPIAVTAPREEDEVSQALAIPGVRAKMSKAETSVGTRTAPYIQRAFRFCYSAAFRAEEITEGLGITDAATISRFRSACKALLAVGLFTDAGEGRYTVNQAEVSRLRALAGAMRG